VHGGRLSADAVQYLLAKYVAIARTRCPSLKQKQVSPHVLRHTAAMELLPAGVDCSVIALWLGHESVETIQVYLHAHLPKGGSVGQTQAIGRHNGGQVSPRGPIACFSKRAVTQSDYAEWVHKLIVG
jgi:integrase/recombinase XerD